MHMKIYYLYLLRTEDSIKNTWLSTSVIGNVTNGHFQQALCDHVI